MPTFFKAGIWKAICTKTPSGLPMAMARKARFWSVWAMMAYKMNEAMTMRLLNTGAKEDQKYSRFAFKRPDTIDEAP